MATTEPLTRFSYTQYHMGVDARITLYAPDRAAAERAGSAAFARIAALDTIMSDYRRDSELNRLVQQPPLQPTRVSPELMVVLRQSAQISDWSSGAFDITAGPLIRLWRAARKAGKRPSNAEITEARSRVGWKRLRLDPAAGSVTLERTGIQLDLGGIAKGYAADEAQRELKKQGISRALVELGGDVVLSGAPPETDGWTVRVPNAGNDQGPVDLKLADVAISTSGDTFQFAVIDGRRYSHVVDPRSGEALTNRVQVTVTAKAGLISDPLSTALSVLGRRDQELIGRFPNLQAWVRVLPGLE